MESLKKLSNYKVKERNYKINLMDRKEYLVYLNQKLEEKLEEYLELYLSTEI